MSAIPAADKEQGTCHKDISLGKFNGIILFSYLDIDTTLSAYIDYSLKRVQEHQIKASAINDTTFKIPKHHVYGAFFEIKGNAASQFQFYLTDSTQHFVKAELFFNATPNYDSLFPILQYIKPDLYHLIETLEWK
jgi:gliding motility-associated lipoprotein GldD